MGLGKYFAKRNFRKTPEPRGKLGKSAAPIYVIQEHHASHLHYDFRLESGGTLKSWAIPKGPSLDPKVKRLAVEVEDHPLDYAKFEGDIPKGQYGGGNVVVWDYGSWAPGSSPDAALKKGRLDFELFGEKLRGKWSLVRLRGGQSNGKTNWLLIKKRDAFAQPGSDVLADRPGSVLETVAKRAKRGSREDGVLKNSRLPATVTPQLAQLVGQAPSGPEWIHEIKYDGYRTLCRIQNGKVRLITRSGLDWTKKYPLVAAAARKLQVKDALLDGEIVWLDEEGHSNFQGLQNALMEKHSDRLVYYVFDLLHLNGKDLRELPLVARKEVLKELLGKKSSKLLYSEHWQSGGERMYREACRLRLEGIVSKRAEGAYVSGRDPSWQKTKCTFRQEMVIGGYAKSDKEGRAFKGLLLGVYEGDQLRYAGKVGTGYTAGTMMEMQKKLGPLVQEDSPFDLNSPRGRDIVWVKPKLVAEVEFRSWTSDQLVRQASFQGLRLDKKPAEIHREEAVSAAASSSAGKVGGVKISHPDRVVYMKSKTKKIEVVKYYEAVSELMLPFLKDRPVSVLRCQENSTSTCFFQKHSEGGSLSTVKSKRVHYKDKKGNALSIQTERELLTAVQMGVLEFHGWEGRFSHITKPDLVVFDLDPETPKLWGKVVDTAWEIKEMLERLGLRPYVKVTGGKGLHVQAPIAPLYSWDQVKDFSKSLMRILEEKNPRLYTTNMMMDKRQGRIFLDYLRNGYGSTAVLPYSLRARELPTVALPIAWRELKNDLASDQFRLPEITKLLTKRKDPWPDYWAPAPRLALLDGKKADKLAA